jgi:hypothetical protein
LIYTWDNNRAIGDCIVEVRRNGTPMDRQASFAVTVNNFMAAGGDNFTVLIQGQNQIDRPIDLDALIAYIQSLPQPFSAAIEGRIVRLNYGYPRAFSRDDADDIHEDASGRIRLLLAFMTALAAPSSQGRLPRTRPGLPKSNCSFDALLAGDS